MRLQVCVEVLRVARERPNHRDNYHRFLLLFASWKAALISVRILCFFAKRLLRNLAFATANF